MSNLEIVGLTTIIFIGGIVVSAIIVAIPLIGLIKKYKRLSRKLDEQVMPLAEKLKENSVELKIKLESVEGIKQDLEKQLAEANLVLKEARRIKNNPLREFVDSSFDIISMFSKGRHDE